MKIIIPAFQTIFKTQKDSFFLLQGWEFFSAHPIYTFHHFYNFIWIAPFFIVWSIFTSVSLCGVHISFVYHLICFVSASALRRSTQSMFDNTHWKVTKAAESVIKWCWLQYTTVIKHIKSSTQTHSLSQPHTHSLFQEKLNLSVSCWDSLTPVNLQWISKKLGQCSHRSKILYVVNRVCLGKNKIGLGWFELLPTLSLSTHGQHHRYLNK